MKEVIRSWLMFLRSHLRFYKALGKITAGSRPGFYKHFGQIEMLRKLTERQFSRRSRKIPEELLKAVRNLEGEYVRLERQKPW